MLGNLWDPPPPQPPLSARQGSRHGDPEGARGRERGSNDPPPRRRTSQFSPQPRSLQGFVATTRGALGYPDGRGLKGGGGVVKHGCLQYGFHGWPSHGRVRRPNAGGPGAQTQCRRECPPAGMHWKGGRYSPPLQGAQPMPSHCPPDAKCQPQWHL